MTKPIMCGHSPFFSSFVCKLSERASRHEAIWLTHFWHWLYISRVNAMHNLHANRCVCTLTEPERIAEKGSQHGCPFVWQLLAGFVPDKIFTLNSNFFYNKYSFWLKPQAHICLIWKWWDFNVPPEQPVKFQRWIKNVSSAIWTLNCLPGESLLQSPMLSISFSCPDKPQCVDASSDRQF